MIFSGQGLCLKEKIKKEHYSAISPKRLMFGKSNPEFDNNNNNNNKKKAGTGLAQASSAPSFSSANRSVLPYREAMPSSCLLQSSCPLPREEGGAEAD